MAGMSGQDPEAATMGRKEAAGERDSSSCQRDFNPPRHADDDAKEGADDDDDMEAVGPSVIGCGRCRRSYARR